jgi:hypothetical protein
VPRFIVEVSEQTFDSLQQRANEERRPVKDQAGWLLDQCLQRPDEAAKPRESREVAGASR